MGISNDSKEGYWYIPRDRANLEAFLIATGHYDPNQPLPVSDPRLPSVEDIPVVETPRTKKEKGDPKSLMDGDVKVGTYFRAESMEVDISIHYSIEDPSKLERQLAFQDLLDKNGVLYHSEKGTAISNMDKHLRKLEELRGRLDVNKE